MPEPCAIGQQDPPEMPVDRQSMTGFGSFGKPAVLIERLNRILAHHADDVPRGNRLSDALSPCRAAGALMERLTIQLQASDRHSAAMRNRMTGFFLYREGGRVMIRVLTPDGWSCSPHRLA
jgi:hypothetical protein